MHNFALRRNFSSQLSFDSLLFSLFKFDDILCDVEENFYYNFFCNVDEIFFNVLYSRGDLLFSIFCNVEGIFFDNFFCNVEGIDLL